MPPDRRRVRPQAARIADQIASRFIVGLLIAVIASILMAKRITVTRMETL
jgi:hypothetical protein